MTWQIIVGALVGISFSNLAQWAKWITLNKGKAKMGYWSDLGVQHVMANMLLDAAVLVIYTRGWLDEGLYRAGKLFGLSERFYSGNIPVDPQLAVVIMGGADYFMDMIVFIVVKKFGKYLPGFSNTPPEAPAVPPVNPQEGTP